MVAVAYSAGRDSTALLHAAARAGSAQGFDVVALHVHHGLMPQADEWLEFAERQCQRWRKRGLPVRLVSTRLTGKPAKGDSVEAWARCERRAALARLAREQGASAILLAHHRRDQAETVLLQALRGAGAAGLAAMPKAIERDGVWWLRPWLDQPREAIETYLREHKLRHVDDASNADARFARSRLRTTVWPSLTAAFSDAEGALVAVAQRAHEAQQVLSEVARHDLTALTDGGGKLMIARWRALGPARRANALRAWLQHTLARGAPESLVARLLADLPEAGAARWPVDAARQLALYRGRLQLIVPPIPAPAATDVIDLSRPGVHRLPHWGGALEVARAEGGVPASALKACTLRARAGGEQFQRAPRGTPRSLKKQYQAAGVAAWEREGPLVYADGKLLFAPGLGLDARWLPEDRRMRGVTLHWRADGQAQGRVLQRS